MEEKQSFFSNHGNALALFGINIAIVAMLVGMWISHASRIDQLYGTIIQLLQKQ